MGNTPTLQGAGMEPEAHPLDSQWLQGYLGTQQVCAGDVPGLTGTGGGTGPPDGQAKVRQGDGREAVGPQGLCRWELSRAICPRPAGPAGQAAGSWQQGEGKAKAGESQRVWGPSLVSHKTLGTVCASTLCIELCCCQT